MAVFSLIISAGFCVNGLADRGLTFTYCFPYLNHIFLWIKKALKLLYSPGASISGLLAQNLMLSIIIFLTLIFLFIDKFPCRDFCCSMSNGRTCC